MTLFELLISILVVSIMVLSFYSLETYSHSQVIYSDRRVKVQNDITYALEHMSKYVQQAQGRQAIQVFPPGSPDGFRVWVDFNQTSWVRYRLSANTITASCGGSCPASFTNNENLTTKVLSNFSNGIMPSPLPDNPAAGFYVKINPDSLGDNLVEIGLVGRYKPTEAITLATRLTSNPQVEMKTRLICNSCPSN